MSSTDDFAAGFRAFHKSRQQAVTAPFGPLTPVGMAWLDEQPVEVHGAPGIWFFVDGRVRVTLRPGEQPTLEGTNLNPGNHHYTRTLPEVDVAGLWVADGERRIEVALRGNRPIVRPRDPGNPLRRGHGGVPAFPADPAWVIRGEFVPREKPERITVGSVLPGLAHHPMMVGTVTLAVSGRPQELAALATDDPRVVALPFTDSTSGATTWRDGRVVTAAVDGSTATVDFNRTVNQPCAFTDYATCPLPPEGNHLDVEISAGEQIPAERK